MKRKTQKRRFFNKKAGASVGTAIKVLTSVVLGAAMLAGMYGVVKTTVVPTTENKVSSMFEVTDAIELNGGGAGGGVPIPDPVVELKRNGIIPDGATYTPNSGTALTGNGTNTFPDTVQTGDMYEEGDYIYKYNQHYDGISWSSNPSQNGWGVRVNDTSKTTYGAILSEIAGKPVTNMYLTFYDCRSLTTAPAIPNNVTNMDSTFYDCLALTTAPAIPNSVTDMSYTFYNCTSLTTTPTMPSSVTNMNSTFYKCSNLTTAPTIPSSVTNMGSTFYYCTSLTGTIEVNANPTSHTQCLKSTQITGITGSCSQATKDALMATK